MIFISGTNEGGKQLDGTGTEALPTKAKTSIPYVTYNFNVF